jgi:hypothetical protein
VVKLRPPAPLSHASTDALSPASTEELLLELRRRTIRPRERRYDTWDDWEGFNPQGYWSEEG